MNMLYCYSINSVCSITINPATLVYTAICPTVMAVSYVNELLKVLINKIKYKFTKSKNYNSYAFWWVNIPDRTHIHSIH